MSNLRDAVRGTAQDLSGTEPRTPDSFVARRVEACPGVRLARGNEGIALLVEGTSKLPNIELANIRARFNQRVLVEHEGTTDTENLMVVQFLGHDSDVEMLFLDAVALLLVRNGTPTPQAVDQFVRNLRLLLAPVSSVSDSVLVGLWGELFLLANCKDPSVAYPSWHKTRSDKFDFSSTEERVEVKTSTGLRAHEVSLGQIRPLAPLVVTLVSIVTAQGGSGRSIGALTDAALSRAANDADADHVLEQVLATLGGEGRPGFDRSYDEDVAAESIRFYDIWDVPAVEQVPPEVSSVTFRVDLSTVEPSTDVLSGRQLVGALLMS